MDVSCPHCHQTVEVADDSSLGDILCSFCGGSFSLVPDGTVTYRPAETRTLGHFELLEQVGVGAFGTVWRARDTALDRTVAIKIPRKGQLSAAETEHFLREARAAAQLSHPSIVSVHEVGREEDTVYIVSDFVRGMTLADWLTGQRLTPRQAAELCAQIADALEHAHKAGVIHRDLKPGNIMLDDERRPHVMDFGLAKRQASDVTITLDGQLIGTPAYMSPEQAAGQAHKVDGRSDLYSLGVILYQLLTGELPFRGNRAILLHQVLHEEPRPPRKLNHHVPRDLETICLKGLEKNPDRRYRTAGDMAADLGRYLNGFTILARRQGPVARMIRWAKRRRAVAAALLCAAVLALVAAFFAYQLSEERQRHAIDVDDALGLISFVDYGYFVDYEGAQKKIDEAEHLGPPTHPYDYGLLCQAGLILAFQQPSREGGIQYLTAAIKAGQQAVENCQANDPSLPDYHLLLSSASVARGNSGRDLTEVAADVKRAADCAEKARPKENAGTRNANLIYPYLALGNANEDLAFLVELDPAENYQRAIDAFQRAWQMAFLASSEKDQAIALLSKGRVYYRAVATTYLPLPVLRKNTTEELLRECEQALQKAKDADQNCLEAYRFLGLVSQFQRNYKAAEDYFQQAKTRSEKHPNHALYVYQWAQLSLSRGQYKEALSRAGELGNAPRPPGALLDPTKEKACIQAEVHYRQAEFEKAKAKCDEGLKEVERAGLSDVNLLLTRARCNIALANANQDAAAARAAIQDAERAEDAATLRDSRASAHWCAAQGHELLWKQARNAQSAEQEPALNGAVELDRAIEAVGNAVGLAPRRPHTEEWLRKGVEWRVNKMSSLPDKAFDEKLKIIPKAIDWQEQRIKLANPPKPQLTEELKSWLNLGIDVATKAGNNQQADAWKKVLDGLKREKRG